MIGKIFSRHGEVVKVNSPGKWAEVVMVNDYCFTR